MSLSRCAPGCAHPARATPSTDARPVCSRARTKTQSSSTSFPRAWPLCCKMTRSAQVSVASLQSPPAALPPHALLMMRCVYHLYAGALARSLLQQGPWLHIFPAQGQCGLRHPAHARRPEHASAGEPVRFHVRLRGLRLQGRHLQRGPAEEGPHGTAGPLVGHKPWPLRRHVCSASRCTAECATPGLLCGGGPFTVWGPLSVLLMLVVTWTLHCIPPYAVQPQTCLHAPQPLGERSVRTARPMAAMPSACSPEQPARWLACVMALLGYGSCVSLSLHTQLKSVCVCAPPACRLATRLCGSAASGLLPATSPSTHAPRACHRQCRVPCT